MFTRWRDDHNYLRSSLVSYYHLAGIPTYIVSFHQDGHFILVNTFLFHELWSLLFMT